MTTLTEAGTAAVLATATPIAPSAPEPVTVLDPGGLRQLPAPLATPLSRVRGGMYSSTVDLIRFADGSTAHTDLIRLNPNIDAYSLDFGGRSPRRLAHYREASWHQAPQRSARWRREITRLLTNSYPAVSTTELTRRLRESGYPLGTGEIRRHEAIAATQAAIWHLTNGLELDVQPLDAPIAARARIGAHPAARPLAAAGSLEWHTPLPAGETAYLELTLAEALQLRSYAFTVGARTGRHPVEIRLEQSTDGVRWNPVSGSAITLDARGSAGRRLRRRLGVTATLASADAAAGHRGHRHYRLAASGPLERDGLLDLRQVAIDLGSGQRFRNNDRVVYLYDLLLDRTAGIDAGPALRQPADHDPAGMTGPFTLAGTAATVSTSSARVVDAEGNLLWGPIDPGTSFYLRHSLVRADRVEVRLRPYQAHARLLLGSSTPGGPAEFTPLVALAAPQPPASTRHAIEIQPGTVPGSTPSEVSRPKQEPIHVR